jgi:ComF family protein
MEISTIAARWLGPLVEAIDTLVFPRFCALCGMRCVLPAVCDRCRDQILQGSGPACPRCGHFLRTTHGAPRAVAGDACGDCRGYALGFDGAFALAAYEGPVRRLCLRLKRATDAFLAPALVDLFDQARGDAIVDWLALGGSAPAWVVPIPLHWRRRWARRYNQADALAVAFARLFRLRCVRALSRVRATRKLADLTRAERAVEMHGAFRATARARSRIAGRDAILVDDILTTGATCSAAARVLKRAGARRVLAVVMGRAVGYS